MYIIYPKPFYVCIFTRIYVTPVFTLLVQSPNLFVVGIRVILFLFAFLLLLSRATHFLRLFSYTKNKQTIKKTNFGRRRCIKFRRNLSRSIACYLEVIEIE